jgi:hypothetical protein
MYEKYTKKKEIIFLKYINMKEKASWLGIGCSFLIPIVGVVCYFVQKQKVENPNSYLVAALCGFIVNCILLA